MQVVLSLQSQSVVEYGSCIVGGTVGDLWVAREESVSVTVLAIVTSEQQAATIVNTLNESSDLSAAWEAFLTEDALEYNQGVYCALRDRLVQEASAA